jgi:uncharacterized MAPEG superfamily protein
MTSQTALTPEFSWLGLTLLATALMWLPYVLDRFVRNGIGRTLGFGNAEIIQTAWATRAKAAHANAVENLVVFAPAVLIAHMMSVSTPLTMVAAEGYFVARLAHYVVYLLGIPVLRTLSFLAGWAAQLVILGAIFRLI